MKRFIQSFKDAFRGIYVTIKSERNIKVMIAGMLFMIVAGILVKIAAWEWAAIVLCFALVLSLELHNTAIEALGDAITLEQNEYVGHAKDAGSGSVLIASICAFLIGCITFLNNDTRPLLVDSIMKYNWIWAANLAVFLIIIAGAIEEDKRSHDDKK